MSQLNLVKLSAILTKLQVGKTLFYSRIVTREDFPRAIEIAGKGMKGKSGAQRWAEHEIDAWLLRQLQSARK